MSNPLSPPLRRKAEPALKSIPNPTQGTQNTFERNAAVANTLEQMSRISTPIGDATPYLVKQALIHAFAEGGWRHGFTLMPEKLTRDAATARQTCVRLLIKNGRKLRVTIAYEE